MASVEYFLGIFFAVLAGICFNLAPAMQKAAVSNWKHDVSFSNMKYSVRTMFTDRKWVFGLMVGAFGVIPFILAMSLAGISVTLFAIYTYKFNPVENYNAIDVDEIGKGLLSYKEGGFILPFEVISVLLVAVMIGAIIIAKGKRLEQ